MKQQSVTQMQKDVRAILEEAVNSSPLEGVTDVGTISINEVIKGVLTKAVTAVANVAPMELFSNPSYKSCVAGHFYLQYDGARCSAASSTELEFSFAAVDPSKVDLLDYDVPGSAVTINSTTQKINIVFNQAVDHNVDITFRFRYIGTEEEREFVAYRNTAVDTTTYLDEKEYEAFMIPFTAHGGSYVRKPEDYLRFLFVQGDTWQRPITTLTPLSSPFTVIARSNINLSVGNEEKPLAVDSFAQGNGVIELYPAPDTADFVYVERPAITTVSTVEYINCDDGIYHAAVLYTAYLVAMIKGYNNAESYKNAALESISQANMPTNATAGAPVAQN